MNELKDELFAAELFAAPIGEWNVIPFFENHHKWRLQWCEFGGDGVFFFTFISPKGRRYSFFTERAEYIGVKVSGADVYSADGMRIASWWEIQHDKAEKLDAVLRLTPDHIIDRLHLLLAAIG